MCGLPALFQGIHVNFKTGSLPACNSVSNNLIRNLLAPFDRSYFKHYRGVLRFGKNSGEVGLLPFLKIVDSFVKSRIALSVCKQKGGGGFYVGLSPSEGIVPPFSPQ